MQEVWDCNISSTKEIWSKEERLIKVIFSGILVDVNGDDFKGKSNFLQEMGVCNKISSWKQIQKTFDERMLQSSAVILLVWIMVMSKAERFLSGSVSLHQHFLLFHELECSFPIAGKLNQKIARESPSIHSSSYNDAINGSHQWMLQHKTCQRCCLIKTHPRCYPFNSSWYATSLHL